MYGRAFVVLGMLAASACATLSGSAVPAARGRSVSDGISIEARMDARQATPHVERALTASGYAPVVREDRIDTRPERRSNTVLVISAEMVPADYPDGRRTVIVLTGEYSTPGAEARQVTAENPALWAELQRVAAALRGSVGAANP